jgi:hypothetical protein
MSSIDTQEVFDVYANYATDEEAEVKGRWFPIGKNARVKVARVGNDNYNAEFRKLVEDKQLDLSEGGPAAEQLASDILLTVQAKTVLVDWEGLGFQGKPVPYSVDSAKSLLAVKDFRKRILAIAESFDNFRVKQETQQGNDSSAS